MSTLSRELDRYLTIRRSLGYRLRAHERILRKLVAFAEQQGAEHISTDLFLRWQKAPGSANRHTRAQSLAMVRLFAQWLHGIDSEHEVPPKGLIPRCNRRPNPYIYSDDEIRRIVEAAAKLPSANDIRALTYPVLFGLIAVTGMRISEALSLDVGDVDLETGVVTIQRGKFGKSRLLPLSTDTTARLTVYARERDRRHGCRPQPFFVSDRGERIAYTTARETFVAVCKNIGLRPAQRFGRSGHGPRIHDLRHTFAVRTIMNWYRTGKDPAREMIKLTTYLGHADPADTYWYIEAVPELLELASTRATASLAGEVLP
jgi:integrase/recombinase XerD